MFDELDGIVESLMNYGDVTRKVEIGNVEFVIKPLTSEEVLLANSTNALKELQDELKEEELQAFNDVFSTSRLIAIASFYVVEVNGIVIHKAEDDMNTKVKKAKEFRKKLRKMPPPVLDKLVQEHAKVLEERSKVYENIEEFAGK